MLARTLFVFSLVLLGGFQAPGIERKYQRHLAMAGNVPVCKACMMHEKFKALSLEAIKEHILIKLGLTQLPNMTGRAVPKIPTMSMLMDMYGMQSDQPFEPGITHHEENDTDAVKTDTVFVLEHSHQRLRHSKGNLDVLYFQFSDKVLQHRVARAELALWIWGDNQETDSLEEHRPVTITLQRILQGTNETDGPLLGPPLTTRYARPYGRGDWIKIDVKRMVAEWFKHPRDNLGVALKVVGPGDNRNRRRNSVRLVETTPGTEYGPYLEVQIRKLDSQRSSRIKRNIGLNCDESSQETRCCRYKLTVDFEKFGWDWIIAPKKYDANYCSGECPMAFLPGYPNTHIVSLADPPNNTGPCCAPRQMGEITMLYFDNEYQIMFSRLPGMVVERCGCL